MSTLKIINIIHPSGSTNNIVMGSAGQIGVNGGTFGTSGQVLTSGGSSATPTWANIAFTQTSAVATTSGTAIDITGIPSSAKVIMVNFNAVSTTGSNIVQLQLGSSSGGVETTGYVCTCVGCINGNSGIGTTSTTGFNVGNSQITASLDRNGVFTLSNVSGNLWTVSGIVSPNTYGGTFQTCGVKTLSSTLDRVRISTNATDTFDAGSWSISYA